MKPTVFNYQEYERVAEENRKLNAEVANLRIRCRIAESDQVASKSDLISRQDAIDALQEKVFHDLSDEFYGAMQVLDELPSVQPKTGWIPIKWHEITDEEREREGYPKDWVVYLDCDMPCDGDEILVQTKNGCIRWDVCYTDGELSLDSGWDWIDDIVAWMPLPEPYREDGEA